MYANYHTHTARCKHAEGEDREYVEAAIEAGIRILGFSDHCPWVYPTDYISTIRMEPSEVDGYFHSLETLRREYQKEIEILIGFEAEYIPALMEEQNKLLENYPLDYMILGQHFLGVETESAYTGRPTTDEAFLARYVDLVIEAMNTGKYLYAAHPDLIHYIGDNAVYRKHMQRLCQYLKEHNIPIEINMLGAYTGRHYPSEQFLQIAKETGNTCIIGVDAHAPDQLQNEAGTQLCNHLIKKYGLSVCDALPVSRRGK